MPKARRAEQKRAAKATPAARAPDVPSERDLPTGDLPTGAWWAITIVLALVVYAPTLAGDWLWDDEGLVHDAHGLARIWTGAGTYDYFPLTLTSFWIESQLSDGPMLHRVVSLALHVVSACLIGSVAVRLAVPFGRAAGVLFAVHPMAVTSVAWIAERKNTLSLVLALLALLALLPRRGAISSRALALSVVLFTLALLAKTQVVALPFVMLGVLWLRGGRPEPRVLGALGTMVVIGAVLGLVTIHFQRAVPGIDPAGVLERVVRAADAVRFQLVHTLWPSPLAMVHARDAVSGTSAIAWLSLIALVIVAAGIGYAAKLGRTWATPAGVALASYVALLAPTLGLVSMAFMRFAFVSEHFGYAALAVPLVALVALAARVERRLALAVLAASAIALTFVSHAYASAFTSRLALWSRDVEVVHDSPFALGNLALEEEEAGRHDRALTHARRAVELAPDDAELHSFLGTVLMQQGSLDEAIVQLERALELDSSLVRAHNNLATVLVHQGRLEEATVHLEAALALTPDYAIGHMNLARVLAVRGRAEEAEAARARAVALDPSLAGMPLPPPAP